MLIVNRRINFDFNVHQTFEAGIVLTGSEVKSIRKNNCSIVDCYVSIQKNELWILNWNIPQYEQAFRDDKYDPKRPRKLLVKHTEIDRIIGLIKREGYTIVISKLYSSHRGYLKVELALVTSKKKYDKRRYIKEKDQRKEAMKKFD